MLKQLFLILCLVVLCVGASADDGFLYQGKLREPGNSVTGTRYFRFTIFGF